MPDDTRAAGKAVRYPGFVSLFLVWTLIGVLAYARHYLQESQLGLPANLWPELLDWLSCFFPWVFLAPIAFRLEERFPLARGRWLRNLPPLALAGLVVSYVAFESTVWLGIGIDFLFYRKLAVPKPLWALSLGELCLHYFVYWSTVAAGYIIRGRNQLHLRERESAQLALEKSRLETSLWQAELEALRMRLNPHFLFNTLQNISVLTQQEPRTASVMLSRLGDLLRMALRRDFQLEIALETEIALTKAYVDVEKMRFADKLSVVFDVERETERAIVPSLLLQPLVENAILHGLNGGTKTGAICIRSQRQYERLLLSVTDNGKGPPAESLQQLNMGVGLGSTCERLMRMYPGRHELTIHKLQGGGTEVRVILPFQVSESVAGTYEHSIAHRR